MMQYLVETWVEFARRERHDGPGCGPRSRKRSRRLSPQELIEVLTILTAAEVAKEVLMTFVRRTCSRNAA